MNMKAPDLRADLLARLRPFVTPEPRHGEHSHGLQLFSYCSLERERLLSFRPPDPILGIVLRGAKEVWHDGRSQLLRRGTVFALPRDLLLDIVNIPDDRSGVYESLVLPLPDLPAEIRPRPAPHRLPPFEVSLTPALVDAIARAATAIARSPHGAALARLRLTEMLLLLDADPAGQLLLAGDLVGRARWLIASRPDHDWCVAELAQELAMGASTLRRRLDRAGWPFRSLLADIRMQAAQAAIRSGASVAEAAGASGYRSRSHFARAYRAAHGLAPKGDRSTG